MEFRFYVHCKKCPVQFSVKNKTKTHLWLPEIHCKNTVTMFWVLWNCVLLPVYFYNYQIYNYMSFYCFPKKNCKITNDLDFSPYMEGYFTVN